jgi:hypothetical protein
VIAGTFDKNDAPLEVAANVFGFVGLVLDILGTSFGVVHTLALQRSIRRMPELQHSRSDEYLIDTIGKLHTSAAEKKRVVETLEEIMTERKKFWVFRRHSVDAPVSQSFRNHLDQLFLGDEATAVSQLLHWFSKAGVEQSALTLGEDPMYAMGGGVVCLLLSVLILAAYSQPRSVWLACIVVTVLVASSMVCSLWMHDDSTSSSFTSLHVPLKHCYSVVGKKQRLLREVDTTVRLDDDNFDSNILKNTLQSLNRLNPGIEK